MVFARRAAALSVTFDFGCWPFAINYSLGPDVSFRGEAEVGRAAEFTASVRK
jgi:hypothetical protein